MTSELRLEWEFPEGDEDIRNCRVWSWFGETKQILYIFETDLDEDWQHSIMPRMTDCFRIDVERRPPQPYQFCVLEWKPNKRHGLIWMGRNASVEFDTIMKRSNPTSKSRRFMASNGEEHKWQQAGPDDRDLECYPPSSFLIKRGPIATWEANSKSLTIAPSAKPIMDDLVCTLLIHLWRLKWGHPW